MSIPQQPQQPPQDQEPEKSSLLAYIFGILFGSKFVFLLLILGIIALYVFYSQSSQLEENTDDQNKEEIEKSQLEIDVSERRKKKKKKKLNEIIEEANEELIVQSPRQNEEIHVSFSSGLNTIHEINESQNDETINFISSQVLSSDDELEKSSSLLNKQEKIQENKTVLFEVSEKILSKDYSSSIYQNIEEESHQIQETNVGFNQKENTCYDDETKLIESIVENIYSVGVVISPVLENKMVSEVSNNREESTQLNEVIIDATKKKEVSINHDDDNEIVESIMELKTYTIEVNNSNNTDLNYEITSLLDSITVSTQGKNEPAITISANESKNETQQDENPELMDSKLSHQDSIETSHDQTEIEVIKSEVNIQYKHPNTLQQINISDCDDRYVEFDDKTNRTIFNDDFKESLEDLSYDREEMGSRISLQTDKTLDSSIDDLTSLEKLNKQFEIVEKKSSSDSSDKFEIFDTTELSKTLSNENGFELINRDTPGTNSNDDNNNNNNNSYHDESDGISNRLKEQFSSNSLLGKS